MSLGAFSRNSHRRRVVVTGVGMVTPLGTNVSTTWEGLLRGNTATVSLTKENCPSYVPSTVKENPALVENLFSKMSCKVVAPVPASEEKRFAATPRETRAQLFAKVAVAEAMQDCGRDGFLDFYSKLKAPYASSEGESAVDASTSSEAGVKRCATVGVNFGMGMPGLPEVSDAAWHLFGKGGDTCEPNKIHPYFVPKVLGNTIAGDIARVYQLRGPCHSSVTACATGAHCIGDALRWIQNGDAKAVVCGSSEACIHPVSMAGFSRMKALATKFNDTPETSSRPFDSQRGGFVMGEGCGALVLEDLEMALARGVKPEEIYGEVRGYGQSGDAHHVSSPLPDGSGVIQCLKSAMYDAEVRSPQIGYVNAHATSTPMGDEIELRALANALRPGTLSKDTAVLPVSSSKGNIGHLLGAAGSVESIITLLSLKHGKAPGTANLTNLPGPEIFDMNKIELFEGRFPTKLQDGADGPNCVINTSFGFGGTNAALVFAAMK